LFLFCKITEGFLKKKKEAVVTRELAESLDHGGEYIEEEGLEFGQEWDDTYFDWNMEGFPLRHNPGGRLELDLPALLRTSRCRVMESRNWMQSFYRQHGIWVLYFDEEGDLLCPGVELDEDLCSMIGTPLSWSDWVKRNFELCRSHEDRLVAAKFVHCRMSSLGEDTDDLNEVEWDTQVTWTPPVHHWTPEAVSGIWQGDDLTGIQRVFSWVCQEDGKRTVFCHPPCWSGAMLLEAGEVVRASSLPLWDPVHPVRALLSAMNMRSHLEPWFIHPCSPRSNTLFVRSVTQEQDMEVGMGELRAVSPVCEEMADCDALGDGREVEATGRRMWGSYVQVTPSGQGQEGTRSGRGVVTPLPLSELEVPERCVVKLDHLLRIEGERKQWHRKVKLKKVPKVAVTQWIPVNRVCSSISLPKKLRARREEKQVCSAGLALVMAKFHNMNIGENGRMRKGVRGRRNRGSRVKVEEKSLGNADEGDEKKSGGLFAEWEQEAGGQESWAMECDHREQWAQEKVADKEPPDPP
jgi:hypothetical protein